MDERLPKRSFAEKFVRATQLVMMALGLVDMAAEEDLGERTAGLLYDWISEREVDVLSSSDYLEFIALRAIDDPPS